jgi:hypothetical protein
VSTTVRMSASPSGAPDLALKGAGQIARGRRGQDRLQTSFQGAALAGQGRGGEGSNTVRQGKDPVQPQLEAGGQHIRAHLIGIGDVTGKMGQAGLMGSGMALLCAVAIGTPDAGPVPVHHGPDHDGAPGWRGLMDHRLAAAKHPMAVRVRQNLSFVIRLLSGPSVG